MRLVLILLMTLFSANAQAKWNSYIGTNLIYSELKDDKPLDRHEQITAPEFSGITYGEAFELDNKITIFVGTNRLYNKAQKRQLSVNGNNILSSTRIRADYVTVGRRYGRYIPGLTLSNNQLRTKLYYKGSMIENSKKSALLYGLNLTTLLNKKISFSTTYVFGNDEFNLDYTVIVGLNYNF